MERKIFYLINPKAGTGKKDVVEELIRKRTEEHNILFEILYTNAEGDYDYLKKRIVTENVTDLVMVGGDGTINHIVAELADTGINFGIIPMGSGNGLAFTAGIPKNPKKALDIIFLGQSRFIDAFKINNRFSCMLSGLGFDAQVAHDFSNSHSRGLLAYSQQSLKQYVKAHPYQFQVFIDSFSFFADAFFISIANSNQFGNHFTIAPKASLNDGLLDIVIAQKMNKAKLPFAILQQIRGNNKLQQLVEDMSSKNILYFQTPSIIIKNLKNAPLHIDGEPAETAEEFTIEIIPNCFKLIQPIGYKK